MKWMTKSKIFDMDDMVNHNVKTKKKEILKKV